MADGEAGNVTGEQVAVIGLGYVGLPLAVALARFGDVVGYDIDAGRVAEIKAGTDRTGEIMPDELNASTLTVTADLGACREADVFIITVPTPVDGANRPDLGPLCRAVDAVAGLLRPGKPRTIVLESTVYPGVTEEVCGPRIAELTGLQRGRDFFLGYSPERINPGDREHTVGRVIKVIAGENEAITEQLAALYGRITTAGVFRAKSIKVAEAAKVIENAQRDINIAFMNEITQIFSRLGLSARDVLDTAGTKWNFLPFRPGLVGGHCIGVDPYYLSHCAQSLGHLPRVILAGRAINDGMGAWIADQIHERRRSRTGRILCLGVTFKEDVPDLRNSKVLDLAHRLSWLGHEVVLHDPVADPGAVEAEFGRPLTTDALAERYDVVLAAVPHASYRTLGAETVAALAKEGGLVADLHGIWREAELPPALDRWVL